ncbi:MAG TPA: chemotaxis protein CheA [Thermoanaerobaculia bacterium]|nr:chemotaxis protein CheA [Thermoanaerobaculia bacterium]
MLEFDRQELIRAYLADAEENLALIEQSLLALEERPGNATELIDEIFRGAHTLKGNSASLGFDGLTRLAHAMEDLLDEMRVGRLVATREIITVLLRSCDAFRRLIPPSIEGSAETPAGVAELLEALVRAKGGDLSPTPSAARELADTTAISGQKLRIDLERLDRLVDLTSELSIAAGRLVDGMSRLAGRDRERLLSSYEDVARIAADLQEQIAKVRMVPIGPRFEQQRRIVRDLAHAAGKTVRLVTEGSEVELDASLVQQLKDPLTHMIRNAVDHGIEQPDVRRKAGKDVTATITLAARQDAAEVLIEVRDDGSGFDRDRILARARERGMVAQNAALSDEEIDSLVFAPGFSTAASVTEISGRGVGMDVVARAIAAMRGSVRVTSHRGEGTTLALRLPLTLAMMPGLVVEAGRERFVIAMHAITRCAAVPSDEPRERASGLIESGGEVLPFIRLRRMFALECEVEPRVEQLVVVQFAGMTAGLITDDVLGEMEAVIKPLGGVFRNVAAVSASTIFPDGRVGLILDVAALVQRAIDEEAA